MKPRDFRHLLAKPSAGVVSRSRGNDDANAAFPTPVALLFSVFADLVFGRILRAAPESTVKTGWRDVVAGAWTLLSISLGLALFVNHARGLPIQPWRALPSATSITSLDLDSARERGAILIDTRSPEEYKTRHLSGALNLPYQEVVEGRRPPSRRGRYVFYCSPGCGRALKVAQLAAAEGYHEVFVLDQRAYVELYP